MGLAHFPIFARTPHTGLFQPNCTDQAQIALWLSPKGGAGVANVGLDARVRVPPVPHVRGGGWWGAGGGLVRIRISPPRALAECNDLSYLMQLEMMRALNAALSSPKLSPAQATAQRRLRKSFRGKYHLSSPHTLVCTASISQKINFKIHAQTMVHTICRYKHLRWG